MKRKVKYKLSALCVLIIITIGKVSAQQMLSIEECYDLAKANYPMIKQLELLGRTKEYSLDNASKGLLPQLTLAGQATYQSEVTSLAISVPGVNIQSVSKDQYKLYAEAYQPLSDFKSVRTQKDIISASTEIEKQKIEVELYKIKDRVNQLYFTVLLLDRQILQSELLIKDVEANIKKVNEAIKNGTSTKLNGDLLRAEVIKINQRIIELKSGKKAAIYMLGNFINKPIEENVLLQLPLNIVVDDKVNRPELKLYDLQKRQTDLQYKVLDNRKIPKLGVFLQAGIGRPALNLLSNDIDGYYIGGLRFNWNFGSFYTYKKDKALIDNTLKSIDLQKETFLLNTKVNQSQQATELDKYNELINTDKDVIALRTSIKKTADKQLENGIISPLDYINYLNAEDQAKQNLIIHEIQLIQAQYNLRNTNGN